MHNTTAVVIEMHLPININNTLLEVNIPSMTSVAMTDFVITAVLTTIMIITLFYYLSRRHYAGIRKIVMGITVVVLFAGLVLISVRSAVPVGYTVSVVGNTTYVHYVYGSNPFARLYLVPVLLGIVNIVIIVVDMIRDAMRVRYKYSGYIRWGR